jgi:hypothetical protein
LIIHSNQKNVTLQKFFLVVLGFELKALCCHTSSPFCSGCFGIVLCFAQANLNLLPAVAGMTGVYHHTQLSIEMVSHELFLLVAGLEA